MSEQSNKKEKLINYFESVSPYVFIYDSLGEEKATSEDAIDIVEDLREWAGLSDGVINVLLSYVLIKNDMKLSRPYIIKIARHWRDEKVKTVREAIELAKKHQ